MAPKRSVMHVAAVIALGCASGAVPDDALVEPASVRVLPLAGGNGVLELFALTLSDTGMYAALRNTGDQPACSASLSVELFDADEQPLAAGIGGLHTDRFYRLADGSAHASCVAPGDVTMAAITDLPPELEVDEVSFVVYRCSYFALDVLPIAGLTLRDVERRSDGSYAGTLVNELEISATNPSVTVFAINRVGRPLGVATSRAAIEVEPGARWAFETNALDLHAHGYVAYPAAALSNEEN